MDLNKHKETFINEARTHLKNMNLALMELEKSPTNAKQFHTIFRAAHTLKTLSATMNYQQSMALCHVLEDTLDAIRQQKITLANSIDLLFQSFDHLSQSIKNVSENQPELDSQELISQLQELIHSGKSNSKPISNGVSYPEKVEKLQAIEVKVDRLDVLMNLAEELLVNKMRFDAIKDQVDHPELATAVEALGRLITELQFQVMQVRLVPVEFIFNRFLRMARDLAKSQQKEIDLQIEGGEIELDRLLIDEIGESLAHLIRNAIDHGLETPEIRKEKNKPPAGKLFLRALRSKEVAVIQVSDDGSGLNLDKLKKLGIEQGLISFQADDEKIKELIFSEISTRQEVTPISGRGLGLSIVKHNIEVIGGNIKVESQQDRGTTFTIEIPLTLAIIRTLFVKVANETFAIPIDAVERLMIIEENDVKGLLEDKAIIFEDKEIPIVRLRHLFNKPSSEINKQPIVIIHRGHHRLGLAVDSLISTQEVVIKPLSRAIRDNKYFSGAALVGSGQMVLILDVAYLLKGHSYGKTAKTIC